MIKILKNEVLDKELDEDGFVVVPFLNQDEIATLTHLFYEHHQERKTGFYASSHLSDIRLKNLLNDAILSQMQRSLDTYFDDCNPLGGSYIVKYPGDNGSLDPHQDWSIVDESKFRSFNIWIPLVDTTLENGAISVLPHSHKLIESIRGVNIPDPYQDIKEYTWTLHQPLLMKAGDALIYDHRLLHASKINKTDTPRLAVVFGIMPSSAEMRYYFMKENTIHEYACDAHFFLTENIIEGPKNLSLLKTIDSPQHQVTKERFDELYFGKVASKYKKNWLQRIVHFFQ